MIPDPLFSTLLLVSLVWLCVMLLWTRPSRCAPARHPISLPAKPPRKRSKEPTPFAGLTHKPHCALCEPETAHPKPRPPVLPAPMPATNQRPRAIDTTEGSGEVCNIYPQPTDTLHIDAASCIDEIGWLHMLRLVLGSSTHAFALRLSAVTVGLACVGLWLRRKIDTRSEPAGVLGWVQVAMGQRMWSCTRPAPNLSC